MELFDKLLISRMFCYFQGLWATPKHQKNLFKLSTKCFVIKWNNFEGWDLRNFRFLKNHHFKSHPILHSMHKIESRETSNRKYLSKTILACREQQAKNLTCSLYIVCVKQWENKHFGNMADKNLYEFSWLEIVQECNELCKKNIKKWTTCNISCFIILHQNVINEFESVVL